MSQLRSLVRTASLLGLLLALVTSTGCGSKELQTQYGRRRGSEGGESVNGTAILAHLFEEAGYQVSGWNRLSPKLDRYETIVWAPDDFHPPTEEQRSFLEDWLSEESDRTLIYIGRDYDAALAYWEQVLAQAPPEQAVELMRRRARAQVELDQRRAELPDKEYARWFVQHSGSVRQRAEELSSPQGKWAEEIDVAETEIYLQNSLNVPQEEDLPAGAEDYLPEFEVLLESEHGPLVTRVVDDYWYGSQILVVTNGSFLLNLPLVNHEHRKLAAKVVDAATAGREPGRVVFLESGPGGPPIYNEEPDTRYPSEMDVLTVWPLNVILLHLLVLGILLCLVMFPIFGRARRWETSNESDFGQHIEALGDLLERSRGHEYARNRLQHYQQYVRRESAAASVIDQTRPARSTGRASRRPQESQSPSSS